MATSAAAGRAPAPRGPGPRGVQVLLRPGRLRGLPLRALRLQAGQRGRDPLGPGERVARVVVPPLPRPEQGVLGRVGLRVPRGEVFRELPQPLLGPVRVLRRISRDLGAVQGDRADLAHAQPRAQQQDLREQVRGGVRELLPEPGDRHVIGHVAGADHPERHVLGAQPLDPPRGGDPVRVRPDQQRHHHVRVVPGRPRPARLPPRVERRGVQPPHRLDHQPHRVPRRQPLPHVRRQQERLVPVHRTVTLRHNPILSNTLPANPGNKQTRNPRSANSATAPLATAKPHPRRLLRVRGLITATSAERPPGRTRPT